MIAYVNARYLKIQHLQNFRDCYRNNLLKIIRDQKI